MSRFFDWLDHRTGYRALAHDALYEHIPGGARWRYVWGSTLTFCFFVQVVTGLMLWMAYSPSRQTAWESVYYIQHVMMAGWLLRGVHHFTAHAMVVLLALHFLQVVIDGAYRAPREINFWIGLILMQIVLGLALTGYLLPWDQKGYWATKVATNMMALVPVIGEPLQRLVVGGSEYGHHTLTRFFALHAGVLPGLLLVFLAMHLALFRRHGLRAREPYRRPDTTFWPDQLLRDAVACVAVMIVVLVLVLWSYPRAEPGVPLGSQLGAELGAPANPAESYAAARPELYFLFLFQILKYLSAFPPVIGAVAVPGLILLSLFLMPFIGRWDLGHRFNVVWTMALLAGACVLTAIAWQHDHGGRTVESQHYLAAVAAADDEAERAVELARSPAGIPPAGALALLQSDPKTQGPKLFRQYCAPCHTHFDPAGVDSASAQHIAVENPTASNLWRFGSREWIAGVLDPEKVAGPHYFGNTAFKDGEMVVWVNDNIASQLADLQGDELAEFRRKVESVTLALASEAGTQREMAPDLDERVSAGREAIVSEFACIDCHKFHDDGGLGLAPDLTGYASRDWLAAFIANPEHERFYPELNDRMPAFAPNDEDPTANRLTAEELAMIVAWLRGEWYEPEAAANSGGQ
ncbi:MAG TPA: cytochrome b N-terminal domain-containing protein [Lacipirellulaceae bacterium]|jgi:ubiquinol-cytochrome c reductase cytochrome b subunit|nr:cytochrome b N-terminal domain-containing protein [Lacipirellulaceae bacterium]